VLAGTGDGLQIQVMLQALIRILDAPALVVKPTGAVRRGLCSGRDGNHHPGLVLRGDLSDHAEGDVGVGRAAFDKAAQGGPAAVAGVAAHDESDAEFPQQVEEPGGGVAAIEQHDVAGAELAWASEGIERSGPTSEKTQHTAHSTKTAHTFQEIH
jgi:hypothetical protein